MIEIVDNAIQLTVTTICAIWSGVLAYKNKSQRYFILSCFYSTFAIGLVFWLLYLAIMTYTPKIFYVSDLSWVASFLFLLTLNLAVVDPGERNVKSFVPWIVTVFLIAVTVHLCFFGDYLFTLIWSGLIIGSAYFSTRGLLYARKQTGEGRQMQYFHIAVLFIAFAEFTLWTISCYFKDSTLANPYFWCDFVLSAGLLALIPATIKAVKP